MVEMVAVAVCPFSFSPPIPLQLNGRCAWGNTARET